MFHLIEVIGTMAFAMSGALTAMHKKLDPFGIFIIAFATAVGGGDFARHYDWEDAGGLDA